MNEQLRKLENNTALAWAQLFVFIKLLLIVTEAMNIVISM